MLFGEFDPIAGAVALHHFPDDRPVPFPLIPIEGVVG